MLYGQASRLARFFHAYCFFGNATIGLKGCAASTDFTKLKKTMVRTCLTLTCMPFNQKTGVLCAH